MGSKLYVGNLSYSVTSSDLQTMFEKHGTVSSAEVINDRESGRSKGFGFVQMGSDDEAQAAISALSGQESDGRALTVNEAKPREDRPRTGGGGGGGYGGGGSRGGSSSSNSGGTGYVAREKGNGGSGNRDSDSRRY
ncbi:MAG: RNA-binding protein [Planctomycetota bacterium]|nr:RNA-binding protein [Planctomycetota bacterium]